MWKGTVSDDARNCEIEKTKKPSCLDVIEICSDIVSENMQLNILFSKM